MSLLRSKVCWHCTATRWPHRNGGNLQVAGQTATCLCIPQTGTNETSSPQLALTWHDPVQHMSFTASRNLNLLQRLSWFLHKSALLVFYCSYILLSFDYCDVVWGCCTKEEALSWECLQNFAAWATLHLHHWYSASSTRRELSLSSRQDFHLAQHSFKTVCGHHRPYLKCLLTPTSATHSHYTRQASTGSAHLPLPRTNFGIKAFSYCGAVMWNSLPSHAQNASTGIGAVLATARGTVVKYASVTLMTAEKSIYPLIRSVLPLSR